MRPGGRPPRRPAGCAVSRSTALRHLRRPPLPQQAIPRVIGVDDFALRRRHRYATVITNAETGRRVAVLPDREAATLESWLREHLGIEVVCRDGSAAYAEAVRRALPDAVQVSDRWHLWRNLCDKVLPEVRAHAGCRATINPPRPGGVREQTTRDRWNKVHSLLGQGVGLLDCSRRLNLALNTVKRYARMPEPQALRIAPPTGPPSSAPTATTSANGAGPTPPCPSCICSVRSRNLAIPAASTCCTATSTRAAPKATVPVTTPRHARRLLLPDPENLRPKETALLEKTAAACPEMTALADLVRGFAALLKPAEGNDVRLTEWIKAARAVDLPHLRSLTNGLQIDRPAVDAGLTLPYHNGRSMRNALGTRRQAAVSPGTSGSSGSSPETSDTSGSPPGTSGSGAASSGLPAAWYEGEGSVRLGRLELRQY
ncbi:ISL3 family transposase [Streptomyces sp. TRM72054]|uniref:ISL3 family transposase n=1 Tax=Streptomyces sp. TRM72054 TaxID=2870562 RepID=UPI0021AB57F7|nr:ISL3 family transposase [Streptomyces sp. TRM72054]